MWYFPRAKVTDSEAESDTSSSSDLDPRRTVEDRVFDLQQSVGNRAVQRMISDSGSPENGTLPVHQGNSAGEKLEESTQQVMESGFGTTFDDVRVHTDEDAAKSAASLGADAYTTGRDIYFASGKYAPGSSEGQRLLAHELTHTIQQGEGKTPSETTSASHREAASEIAADPLEREADRVSEEIVQNKRPHVTKAAPVTGAEIQRQAAKSPPTPDWQKRLDEMLPGGHGLVFLMNRDMQLLETFGEAKLIELVNKIYPDNQARELVHIYGVPGIVALDKTNLDVAKARQQLEPKALQDFAPKFPNAADLIRGSVPALRLINEAEADTGAVFGGYAKMVPDRRLVEPTPAVIRYMFPGLKLIP